MGDKPGSDDFLAAAALIGAGAFWAAWKGKPYLVLLCVVVGAAYTVFSAAKFTWGLG